jgi:plasmid stabilization system protein ParE
MKVYWTESGRSNLLRLHDFLAPVNARAAARVIESLTAATGRLPEHARIGEALEQYRPREVRRIFVGRYEMRYEIRDDGLYVLRIWHTRETR